MTSGAIVFLSSCPHVGLSAILRISDALMAHSLAVTLRLVINQRSQGIGAEEQLCDALSHDIASSSYIPTQHHCSVDRPWKIGGKNWGEGTRRTHAEHVPQDNEDVPKAEGAGREVAVGAAANEFALLIFNSPETGPTDEPKAVRRRSHIIRVKKAKVAARID